MTCECYRVAGWSSSVARRAHNPKVVGSNPASATMKIQASRLGFFCAHGAPLFLREACSIILSEAKTSYCRWRMKRARRGLVRRCISSGCNELGLHPLFFIPPLCKFLFPPPFIVAAGCPCRRVFSLQPKFESAGRISPNKRIYQISIH